MESADIPVQLKHMVFEYQDPRKFLIAALRERQRRNPQFSMRAWSRQMGLRGHTLLNHLLSGNRKIKPRHLAHLHRGLGFATDEQDYFDALVHYHAATTETERQLYMGWLRRAYPAKKFSFLEIERFRLIADWYHMAILEMTALKAFRADPVWISQRLGGKITPEQAEEAVERLICLGLLKKGDADSLEKTQARLTTPKDRASEAIRRHHKQVLELAATALEQQTVDERIYNSCAMTIDVSKLNAVKELIQKFRTDLAQLAESLQGQETYQMSVQFFRITENLGEKNEIHSVGRSDT